jgi:dolichol-phosphate mannosyltransferase
MAEEPVAQNRRSEKIGVLIPIYGESDSVVSVLERFPKGVVDTICLVIDVPLKTVMSRIRPIAQKTGATVHIIKNGRRRGVGYAIRQGLRYFQETNHSIFVGMAGNGKDDPSEILKVLEPVLERECDYVQGSRYVSGGRREKMPFVRQVFNRLYPALWTILTSRKCTDVTNGFRSYRLSVLDDPRINLDQDWLNGYSLEYYLHYKVLSLGYKMKEIPVSKIYPFRHKGGYSKIQPLKDWWPIISPLVLLFLGVRK